ncbi:hypothetical protein ACFY00_33145 [Kitasatospora sp. NPDC001540]|uniref:hypothetical protein n=1 Tax=Kitasatospora sp. NPDC001540 TaxID=3364014 RepID=UPI0036C32BF5
MQSRRPRVLAGFAVGCAALLAAGCTSADKPTTPPSSPPVAAPPSSTSPDEAAKAQVLTAYRGMWASMVKIYSSGTLEGTDLEKYAADKALAGIKASEVYYQDQNLVVKGEPVLTPQVTSIDLSANPPTAQITSCVDSSNFLPVDKTSGKPAQLASNVFRHVENSTAIQDRGTWLITQSVIQQDQSC